ncbi:hypothetical protein G9A89_021386 [Geosiphon pyriformis]|nr:hypothetical protein G9A89_021386 [Geosiphon pyriformis]
MPTSWEKKGKGKEKEEDLSEKADEATKKITSDIRIVRRNSLLWKHRSCQTKTIEYKPTTTANHAIENAMVTQNDKTSETTNHLLDEGIWNDILGREGMYDTSCQYTILISDWMVNTKVEGAMPSKILEIKNNSLEPVNIILVPNPDAFFDIKTNSENFYEHYQNLALTKEKQKK